MGDASGLMATAMGVQSVNSISSAYTQSQAMRAQGDYQKQQSETNARLATIQSADAMKRGDLEANAVKRKAAQIEGSQRASAAAQGVDINSGSALDIQAETETNSAIDIQTVKNNAWREAWGYKVQALNSRSEGNMASLTANNEANSTLLTGGMNALTYAAQAGYWWNKMGSTTDTKTTKGGYAPMDDPNDLVRKERDRIVSEYDNRSSAGGGSTYDNNYTRPNWFNFGGR